ncbi:Nibrin [Chionoecetes opilio]|uniref:Nibrin n=1 Tax=Chionoecetes opilio TaxID=41210 RepID=A0A8J4YRL6_CHIOP|nr:Nibrin [Chionoecetes opilio]
MWLLQGSDKTAGQVHYLVCGQPLMVGRRDAHILLTSDDSASRKHATITLHFQPANIKTREAAMVEVRDLESKYGTFIKENQRLGAGVDHELHHGDTVRFGVYNTWRLEHQELTVCRSTLAGEGRQQLINALLTLGGHLQNHWSSDCCYLVMPSVTLTVKVASALADGRVIVLPEFFTKLVDAILQKTSHPDPAQFLPPVKVRTSGKAELLTEDNFQEVVSSKCLLISHATDSQQTNTLYSRTHDLLKQHRLRTVPEKEIGLAILFVSTEGHCNSSFKHSDIFKRSSSTSQPTEKLKVFAKETQDTEFSVSLTGAKVVPESGRQPSTSAENENPASRVPSKRPLTNSDSGGGKAKRSNRPLPDITQPLSTMELSELDGANDNKDDIKLIQDMTFKPEHTSTQGSEAPPSTTLDQSATVSFAPYTLPSLKTLDPEDEEQTQPFCPDKSEEDLLAVERGPKVNRPKSSVKVDSEVDLKFDEWWKKGKEDAVRKRGRSEETSPQIQETKKSKTESDNNSNNVVSNNGNGSSSKKRVLESDDSVFALPARPRQRERTVENLAPCKQTDNSDLFALPTRTQRTRKLPDFLESIPPTPTQATQVCPPTPESKPDVTSKAGDITVSKYIDREETKTTIKDSAETVGTPLSRTVVILEAMVITQPSLRAPPSKTQDSGSLPNYKTFRKVNPVRILKVIGGSDLVESDQADASQDFNVNPVRILKVIGGSDLVESDQADASQDFNVRVVAKNIRPLQEKLPSMDDDLFNLGGPIRKRR